MSDNGFIDYYELMQLSPSADADTIERIFRHLAMKFHPDNMESGDAERFRLIVDAHRVLSDPEKRAGYVVKYQSYWNEKWKIVSESRNKTAFDIDRINRDNVLSILYIQRRRDVKKPGVGTHEMARLLSMPPELVEFHVWYLREKGWVERTETGQMAITAVGVDQVEQDRLRVGKDHMLMTGDLAPEEPVPADLHLPPRDAD